MKKHYKPELLPILGLAIILFAGFLVTQPTVLTFQPVLILYILPVLGLTFLFRPFVRNQLLKMQRLFPDADVAKQVLILPSVFVFLLAGQLNAQVSGTVFRDFNGNGTQDANEPLVSGITVNIYAISGSICGTTLSSGTTAPNYSVAGCGTSDVRVEFEIPSTGSCVNSSIDFSSLSGATYGSSVQFVKGNSTNVNFAITNPADYNTGTAGIASYIPIFISGDPLPSGSAAGAATAFVGFPYSNTGGTSNPPSQSLDGAVIGAAWGVASSKQAQKVFTSAFLKRHTGLGVLGSGGIYLLTPTGTSFTVNQFYDLDANGYRTRADGTAPAYGEGTSYSIAANNSTITYLGANDPLTGYPSGLGVIGTNAQRGLSTDPEIPTYDPAAFDQVGKVGLGDIDISDDGKYLFVMNLYSRKVLRLELNSASNPTSVINVTSYDIPSTTCTNGEYRPFGLKFYRDKLYVGVVCSGENAGVPANLYASVYELNNPTAAATFNTTAVITVPLDYNKVGDYNPWTNNSASITATTYPAPILSNIEFSDNGDMILNIMDRAGHQWGENNRKYLKTNTTSISVSTSGDILIAGLNCSTGAFTLENNGTVTSANGTLLMGSTNPNNSNQGPGGKEFFDDDSNVGDPHKETAMGSAVVLKGQGEIFLTAFAMTLESGDGGTIKLSATNGNFISGYALYNRTPVFPGVFAKANGLGDIEFLGSCSPIEIGNRIWMDTDDDGIQDADEMGIGSVVVKLYQGATEVGQTTSASDGTYYFNSSNVNLNGATKILEQTAYTVRIDAASFPAGKTLSAKQNVGGAGQSDVRDNDAALVGGNAEIAVTTGLAGQNNHTLDIAFKTASACSISVVSATPTACASNLYNLAVVVTYANSPGGNITVTTSNGGTITVAATTSPQTITLTGLTANGAANIGVTAFFVSTPSCTNTLASAYNAPAACPACLMTVTSATPTACASNLYNLAVVVTYANSPGGNITVTTSNGGTITVAATTSPQTITLTGLTANGTANIGVTALFVSTPVCTHTLAPAYNAPATCVVCPSPNCGTATTVKN